MAKPLVLEVGDVAPFDTFNTVDVRAGDMKPGNVIVDKDLETGVAIIDHKIGRAKDSGVTFLVHDLERDRITEAKFHENKMIPLGVGRK